MKATKIVFFGKALIVLLLSGSGWPFYAAGFALYAYAAYAVITSDDIKRAILRLFLVDNAGALAGAIVKGVLIVMAQ